MLTTAGSTIDISPAPRLVLAPVDLVCPCGRPLQLAQTDKGHWVIGHIDTMCSKLVHGPSGSSVLEALHKGLSMGTLKVTRETLTEAAKRGFGG